MAAIAHKDCAARAFPESERGVTLVELLVVLIIIGLLAAIVIAAFTNQQDKAHDADAKTHARSAQTAMESFYVDMKSYAGVTRADLEEQQTSLKDASNLAIVTATIERVRDRGLLGLDQPGHVQGASAADRHDRAYLLARQHRRVPAGRDLVGAVEVTAPELVLLGLCGAAFGSFVNVLAYRLPRRESIVKPRSRCPGCGTTIRSYDNVPIVSWLLLRGRCRDCGMRISVRYPLVEAVTAALFVVLGLKFGREAALWPALALAVTLVAAAATDLEERIIPNRLMAAGAVLALVLWTVADPSRLPENLIAGAAAGGFLLIAALAYPAGMGMGDVKLAAVMGLFLGRSVGPALFVGFAAGALAGMAIMAARGAAARKQGVPFAPFLALGGIVGLLFGSGLIDWYVDVAGLSS